MPSEPEPLRALELWLANVTNGQETLYITVIIYIYIYIKDFSRGKGGILPPENGFAPLNYASMILIGTLD